MGKAGILSRRSDLKVEIENDNKNQKLIKEEWIRGIIEVVVERPEIMLVEKIKKVREKDEEVVKVVEEMKKVGIVKRIWVENRERVSVEKRKDICTKEWGIEVGSYLVTL